MRGKLAVSFCWLLAAVAAAACGCAVWGSDRAALDAYAQARREIESPPPSVRQASFETADPVPQDKFRWEDISPDKLFDKTKQLAGYGANPDLAKTQYVDAEARFRKANELQGKERNAEFLEAAKLYQQAAQRWPDSALEQDALFMVGQSYFFADRYPEANEVWERLLNRHPHSRYLERIEAHRFSIAQYWLQLEQKDPESFFYVNVTDRSRPRHDMRRQALRIFDRIRIDDPTGKLADDATMAAANAHFTRGKFMKADEFYTDLQRNFPTSEHQFRAHLLGLKTKLQNYQGPEYSGEALDEAEKLIDKMRKQFPVEAQEHRDFLARAYAEVRFLQAERDWRRAQYRELRGQNGAARFYYARILEDYSDTPFAKEVGERLDDLQGKPDLPPQRMGWLVDLFPSGEPAKPLIAGQDTGLQRR